MNLNERPYGYVVEWRLQYLNGKWGSWQRHWNYKSYLDIKTADEAGKRFMKMWSRSSVAEYRTLPIYLQVEK